MHAGIDQHENRDHYAMLVLVQEIQSEIDQRQEHEVGEEPVGVAQEQHGYAPDGLWKCRTAAGGPESPAGGFPRLRERCKSKTLTSPSVERNHAPCHCGHAYCRLNRSA